MCHSYKKICHGQKNVSQLEEWLTARKMGHSQKRVSKLENEHRKMCHSYKNGSQLKKNKNNAVLKSTAYKTKWSEPISEVLYFEPGSLFTTKDFEEGVQTTGGRSLFKKL